MAVKVFAVRVGDRYGPEYEDYLRSKIPNIEFINDDQLVLQWNKIRFFNLNLDEPVCVIDIDIELINDYWDLFNYPIERGEFLTLDPWWDTNRISCGINGAFYKFYPSDTKYIYDSFMEDPIHWRHYFIKAGIKSGPVGGEENFVELKVKERLRTKFIPSTWYSRMEENSTSEDIKRLNRKYPGSYLKLDQYHPDLKLLHYNSLCT